MNRNGLQFCALAFFTLLPAGTTAQFNFNNGPSGAPVVPSIANQTCGAGGGMGGMGGAGCDGTPFLQEVVTIGGSDYFHVVVGDTAGAFGIEYYLRTAPGAVCWFGCAGARVGGGMGGMGGPAPLSSSSGSATNDSAPLASTNSGTGRPDAVAIRQINRTPEITQEFLKATESNKPRITQTLTSANVTLNFGLDMSTINYQTSAAGSITLTQAINEAIPPPGVNPVTRAPLPNSSNFNIANVGPGSVINVTGGRYTYSPGAGDGGSLGAYSYFADRFDVYNVNWASYCDPTQNPVSQCATYGGVRGGMGGAAAGGAAAGGGMGGAAAATGGGAAAATGGGAAAATGGGATMGGATGGATGGGTTAGGGTAGGGTTAGGGGMGGGGAVVTTTTTSTVATTTTTTVGGMRNLQPFRR